MEFISLNGQWSMRAADEERLHSVTVPGSVYSAYLNDGTMEDPFWRENELQAYELLKKDYVFSRHFELTSEQLAHPHVLLRCDGLDTLATVTINGKTVGKADNMHITWTWPVREYLRPGENEILIRFDSPILAALEAGEKSPAWCSTDAVPGYPHIRKTHCMYGWDWGPRLPDAGIWKDIGIVTADEALLDSVSVRQYHENGKVRLVVKPELYLGECQKYRVTLTEPDGKETAVEFTDETEMTVEKPRLWWPAGYGDQPLYTLKTEAFAGGRKQDEKALRIGLRTLTVHREKDQWGESFCHTVNGVKIFAMGGDYIPEDNIFSRITPERTRRLLSDARLANFNTVRVWGGGYYPKDDFYDTCDELGLLVWQDCMFACAFYDLTPEFEASIRAEIRQNVKRIRHHASLAILCGNNEMEEFHESAINAEIKTGMKDPSLSRPSHHSDYIKMFEYIIPGICAEEAPQTFYWPSSPSSGGGFDEAQSENRGDTHYWDVWHGEKPFSDYRNHFFRYASEFGFQSFPCLKTVESFTEPGDRNIFSRIMERHQRNRSANGKILAYLSQTYRYPGSFDNLLYASQLLQAEAIRYGVEHWRRNRGRCMGAIYWQLNDCWPVASWASVDYFGRWKALHYYAKRFFAPVMISCEEQGEHTQNPSINELRKDPIRCSSRLNVANETMRTVQGNVRWTLRTSGGETVRSGEQPVTVPALTSLWLDDMDFTDCVSLTEHYFSYSLKISGEEVSFGSVLFCAPKHFAWKDPHLTVNTENDEIVIRADAYAGSICVESDDPDLLHSDNFFSMDPGEKRVKCLRGSLTGLRVRSVRDLDQ
ncbi:MAG: glycoside hydrolase family 2 protein [Clostridia bacterium]|nr:glycoside hydrolase family 2 protein [Clostridia bacterium]